MDEPRDRLMEGRVTRTLADLGLAAHEIVRVAAAHRLAMEPRRERLVDPQHPDFLHPGRTVLILAVDAGVRDPLALGAGALLESERPELRVPAERVQAELGAALADWVGGVPLPGEGVAEALITAPPLVQMVALAERLDHCRHAKFWPDRAAQERILAEAVSVYGPVAERADDALARRFAHWSEAFGRALARRRD
jgi:(p)ppGpp synthase/HD superfamily hydrolase